MSKDGILLAAYINGGVPLLATRIGFIFTKIITEEDKVRHNDMVAEVLELINSDVRIEVGRATQDEYTLFSFIASWVFYKKIDRKKRFLIRLADKILMGFEKG